MVATLVGVAVRVRKEAEVALAEVLVEVARNVAVALVGAEASRIAPWLATT